MKPNCTHYQGICDHLVCPREENDRAADHAACKAADDDLPDFAMLTPPAVRPGPCRKAAEGERDPVEAALLRDIEANGYRAQAVEVRHGSGRVKI